MKISIIVPVAPSEDLETRFLDDLKKLPAGSELIFVSAENGITDNITTRITGIDMRHIAAGPGRAVCLNAGAENSSGDYLWFLHADSRFRDDTVASLLEAINRHPDSLLYFDIIFYDASMMMKLNELGVYFRTRCLKTPFGDQGFCIKKDLYIALGGFPEDAPYGEDHLFVRNAVRKRIPVKPVKSVLYTSARKYRENGWLRTTLLHLFLWQKQIYHDNKKKKGNDR